MDKTGPINTLFDKLLIVGFSAIISIPFIFADKMGGGGISNSENRRLAMMPFVNENHELIPDLEFSELQERTEQWIDDNAYGRDYFYDLMLKANYYLFDVVEKKDLLLGDDNWTFYYNSDIIKDFQHNNIPSQETLNGWVNSFKQISNYYEEKDIKFMGIFLPDKKTVYKEYYPKGIQEIQHQSRSDLLREKFQEANVNFYFAEDDLIHAKGKRLLYSKTFDSAHWNSYGAFVGYQNFMREVKKYFPNIKVVDESDFIINEYPIDEKYLGILQSDEVLYEFVPNAASKNITEDIEFFNDFPNLYYEGRPEVIKKRFINPDKQLPKAVFCGDSMAYDYLFPFLRESFSELTFVHTNEFDKAKDLIEKADPDIILYECVERMFDASIIRVEDFAENLASGM